SRGCPWRHLFPRRGGLLCFDGPTPVPGEDAWPNPGLAPIRTAPAADRPPTRCAGRPRGSRCLLLGEKPNRPFPVCRRSRQSTGAVWVRSRLVGRVMSAEKRSCQAVGAEPPDAVDRGRRPGHPSFIALAGDRGSLTSPVGRLSSELTCRDLHHE